MSILRPYLKLSLGPNLWHFWRGAAAQAGKFKRFSRFEFRRWGHLIPRDGATELNQILGGHRIVISVSGVGFWFQTWSKIDAEFCTFESSIIVCTTDLASMDEYQVISPRRGQSHSRGHQSIYLHRLAEGWRHSTDTLVQRVSCRSRRHHSQIFWVWLYKPPVTHWTLLTLST